MPLMFLTTSISFSLSSCTCSSHWSHLKSSTLFLTLLLLIASILLLSSLSLEFTTKSWSFLYLLLASYHFNFLFIHLVFWWKQSLHILFCVPAVTVSIIIHITNHISYQLIFCSILIIIWGPAVYLLGFLQHFIPPCFCVNFVL